jgi:putative polyketide hydroxylase
VTATETETEVLIVGAGPVGLALLIALRQAGIDAVAVDRSPGPSSYPKARVLGERSMELLRALGAAEAVEAAALPGWADRLVVARTLAEGELLRVQRPGGDGANTADARTVSAERRTACSQDRVERALADRAARLAPNALRWNRTATTVYQNADLVRVAVSAPGGATELISARYAVLADGCRGLGADGTVAGAGRRRRIAPQLSILLDIDLADLLGERPAYIYLLGGQGRPAQLMCVDGGPRWVIGTLPSAAENAADYPRERLLGLLASITGLPARHPVLTGARVHEVRTWNLGVRVAEGFVYGRVLRAGDAAHELPPAGAMGLNLGLADVPALVWRLAAVLGGWGSADLLEAYDAERRPTALRTAQWARECVNVVSAAARAVSRADGTALAATEPGLAAFLEHPGLEIGPLLPPASIDPRRLVTDGRPGSRAPRRWLPGTASSTCSVRPLLVLGEGHPAGADAARSSARRVGVPLDIVRPQAGSAADADVAALIRPDGYVAWRAEGPSPAGAFAFELGAALTRLAKKGGPDALA